jgi:predicted dienelactone hydrolase
MIHRPNPIVRLGLCLAAALAFTAPALAAQAGLRSYPVATSGPGATTMPVALYYPTDAAERTIPMGPFTAHVAPGAAPAAQVKALIVLSHGTGGTEAGHGSLAEALAREGYLVAALRHPGDNWQDRSLLTGDAAHYFDERPRQLSRVIDALLRDPEWRARIASDAQGPRVGALGHSAGGYSVLALAGGEPAAEPLLQHCRAHRAEDPVFCGMGRDTPAVAAPAAAPATPLRDPRVRAVVAMAPAGAVFGSASLAKGEHPGAGLRPGARHLPGAALSRRTRRHADARRRTGSCARSRPLRLHGHAERADPVGRR